jgi:lambda repressor-like predicted transcriptional regulator
MSIKHARYPAKTLLTMMPNTEDGAAILAERLGVSRRNIWCWQNEDVTLSFAQADQYAIRLGYHPSHFWASWFDDALNEKPRPINRRRKKK